MPPKPMLSNERSTTRFSGWPAWATKLCSASAAQVSSTTTMPSARRAISSRSERAIGVPVARLGWDRKRSAGCFCSMAAKRAVRFGEKSSFRAMPVYVMRHSSAARRYMPEHGSSASTAASGCAVSHASSRTSSSAPLAKTMFAFSGMGSAARKAACTSFSAAIAVRSSGASAKASAHCRRMSSGREKDGAVLSNSMKSLEISGLG